MTARECEDVIRENGWRLVEDAKQIGLRHHDAQDAAARAIEQLWRHHERLDADLVAGWLRIVLRNAAYRAHAKLVREPSIEALPEQGSHDDLDEWLDFTRALADLRPSYRAAAVARMLGLSYAEACEALGLRHAQYHARGRKAIRRMQAAMA